MTIKPKEMRTVLPGALRCLRATPPRRLRCEDAALEDIDADACDERALEVQRSFWDAYGEQRGELTTLAGAPVSSTTHDEFMR